MPLPPIENFAYNENNNVAEPEQVTQQQYNYDMSRMSMYGYRNIPQDYAYQMQGQHYQGYQQPIDPSGQHPTVCNPMYQQWAGYDSSMIPSLTDIGQGDGVGRGRHKRSRMSLQKRLLVNARERERMRVLNKAFEALRDALPCYIADGHMAKITTLRLAINYIKALTEVLEEQREIDLEKEKSGETGTNGDRISLKLLELDGVQPKEDFVEDDVVSIDTLKLDKKPRDNS